MAALEESRGLRTIWDRVHWRLVAAPRGQSTPGGAATRSLARSRPCTILRLGFQGPIVKARVRAILFEINGAHALFLLFRGE
jgi:hypothetical protein